MGCPSWHTPRLLLSLRAMRVSSEYSLGNIIITEVNINLSSCITSRRRRRNGLAPYRGTGWAAGKTPPGHAPATYTGAPQPGYGGDQYNQGAPPVYSPPPNNGYYGNNNAGYGANQSYFGGNQPNGIELQQPQNAYQPATGGDPVYQAPYGAPPAKNDGIIR